MLKSAVVSGDVLTLLTWLVSTNTLEPSGCLLHWPLGELVCVSVPCSNTGSSLIKYFLMVLAADAAAAAAAATAADAAAAATA